MPSTNRIPQADSDFNEYINETSTYLLATSGGAATTNWERLGLTTSEKNQWIAYKNEWNTNYGKVVSNNAMGIRSTVDTEAKNETKRNFNSFVVDPAANLLNRIGASPDVTNDDRVMFNIKLRDDNPSPRPAITSSPLVDFSGADGAVMVITCRVSSELDRPSMQPDADVIEMRYSILELNEPLPSSPEECTHTALFTKALNRFEAGIINAGKRLCAYLRWRNNSEPEKSSPWNQLMTAVIGD